MSQETERIREAQAQIQDDIKSINNRMLTKDDFDERLENSLNKWGMKAVSGALKVILTALVLGVIGWFIDIWDHVASWINTKS